MAQPETAMPATDLIGEPASSFEHLGGRLEVSITPSSPTLQPATTRAAHHLDRKVFTTSRLSEFCSVKELTAQTGHGPDQWPLVISVKDTFDAVMQSAKLVEYPLPDGFREQVVERLTANPSTRWHEAVTGIVDDDRATFQEAINHIAAGGGAS
jgi:hypothetical protein